MANFGILRDPQLAASFLGAFDQEQAKQAAAKQQAFQNDMLTKQFGLQEQAAAATAGTAKLNNAKMKQDIFKGIMARVAADPRPETALGALTMYRNTTGDDVSELSRELMQIGGDPNKLRAWAVGGIGDLKLMEPKYQSAGGFEKQVNPFSTAQDIQRTVGADKAFEYSPEGIKARTQIAAAGAMQVPSIVQTSEGIFSANRGGGAARPITDPATGKTLKAPTSEKLSTKGEAELFEASEATNKAYGVVAGLKSAMKLVPEAYEGETAIPRARIESQMGGNKRANATIEYDRIINSISLESLRAVFGGNPTEGERAANLLTLANTAKTQEQKKTALDGLMQSIERQIKFNQAKEKAITSGEYKTQGIAQPNASGGTGLSAAGQAALNKYLPKGK